MESKPAARSLGRDHRLEGLDRRPGHDRLGTVELLAQAVELIEHAQVQLRQQLVSGDQKLQLGDPDQKLLLDDVRLKRHHLSQAGVPVGLQPGLGRRRDRDDPPIVGRRQTQDVAQLSFRGDHVRGLGHQVEVELFEPLLGFGDVGDGSLADDQLRLFAIDDFAGQLDGLLGTPELHVLLGQAPVLLLDRPHVGHDLCLEPPDGGVRVEAGDHDRCAVGLQSDRPTGCLPRQRRTTHEGLGQGHLDVRGVDRGVSQEGAVLIQPVDVVHDADLGSGRRVLLQSDLENWPCPESRCIGVFGPLETSANRPEWRC